VLEDSTFTLGISISKNEHADGVATSNLKMFLLPVLLGDLNLKLNSEDRMSVLNVAEVYFRDFLQRSKEYPVACATQIPDFDEVKEEIINPPLPLGFEEMASQREEKLRKFRETKDMGIMGSRLIELKKLEIIPVQMNLQQEITIYC
jgi:immunoglobulin-binding protein 1